MNINIVLDILILIFASFGILSAILVLFLIFRYRQQSPFTTATLLICNNYVAVMVYFIFLIDIYSYDLYGQIHINVSFDNPYCYIRTFIITVLIVSIYHSYLLQASFRLFRVVFYRHKNLQTIRFISILILIQWFVDILVMLPALFLHYFDYITPDNYYCTASYTNIRVMIHVSIFVYYFSIGSIGSIYFYIIYYMKHQSNAVNQRNLIVVKRILILVGLLTGVGLPVMILYFSYLITNYLYPLIYQLQSLTFSIVLS